MEKTKLNKKRKLKEEVIVNKKVKGEKEELRKREKRLIDFTL